MEKQEIIRILESNNLESIRKKAYSVMKEYSGEKVYYRGLLEFSNICINDCYYCGIRKSNKESNRFSLTKQEIIDIAVWTADNGYGSMVLQSGGQKDDKFIDFVEDVLKTIKEKTISEKLPNGLGITLCVGEQTHETYKRFFDAGAHRYLLRIETTSPILYKKLHPETQTLENRKECLRILKQIGYQVGTGVMIGIPGQTIDDLANDILFFKEYDIDMIGMGPYLIHKQTPMKIHTEEMEKRKKQVFNLSLKMIAAARILLKDVNIAATTALQAMDPIGREKGLQYGANIVMPLVTPSRIRKDYQLYDGKPCIDEQSSDCRECLLNRIKSVGREVGFNEWGDSKHFFKRIK
ncbi:[FeFe] hydrogenase H-cluster radical SAM maturase HydE [Candidatus Woesearchaeota archaeon]|nr:[FeFe] hydrogenase H-cluster radical SAM maturase HydE [Candidatus Woesearchaeota archaeon]